MGMPSDSFRRGACLGTAGPCGFQAGFSLVELLVVLVLAAALASLSIGGLGGYLAGRRLDGEARLLLATLERARSKTLKSGVARLAVFDPAGRSYAIHADADNDGNAEVAEKEERRALEIGILFGSPNGGPASGPLGQGNPSLGVEGGWVQAFRCQPDRIGTLNLGAVYLRAEKLAGRCYCIRKASGNLRLEIWRWSGGSWKSL